MSTPAVLTAETCEQIARSLLDGAERINREGNPLRAIRLIASAERWLDDARRKRG